MIFEVKHVEKFNFFDLGLTSPPGGNQVDGLPPALSSAQLVHRLFESWGYASLFEEDFLRV